jgi:transposase
MNVIHPRCAAIDIGKDVVVTAVRVQEGSLVHGECRTHGTTSQELQELRSWLSGHRVSHVAMEATGSYWKSLWRALEGHFELVLAHPASIKNHPGRKSDVNDATWMADLLAHGLIRGSFVPPAEITALRELTRTRKQFVREVARHTQRIQKILDVANLKITGLITDVLGTSGRAIVRALIGGEANPERLADLAHPRLRVKRERLVAALQGDLTEQQRALLAMHLSLVENLENSIAQLDREIERGVTPFRPIVERLKVMPGFSDVSAPALLAEIGADMSRFKTHRHLVSWARLCPRLDESAGKVHSTRTLKGAAWTKTLMTQAAWAAARTRNSYFQAQFLRLKARRGAKKAVVAVAASMLTAAYYVIRDNTDYRDLGRNYFQTRDRSKIARRFVAQLQRLGYHVQIADAVA